MAHNVRKLYINVQSNYVISLVSRGTAELNSVCTFYRPLSLLPSNVNGTARCTERLHLLKLGPEHIDLYGLTCANKINTIKFMKSAHYFAIDAQKEGKKTFVLAALYAYIALFPQG